ncbi:DUF1692-domain-containing protein [Dacryopinax primogenitus]|uniref:DUF1692-domain-containing protein n=1 Tax=Dacryopinax primogenitus (strain DJM 731) TaxID=1858805 RepID=M5G8E5_DACPD|nr:DUF1692-domain-containing protein [Dacryopinax primogenitus]EJU05029.1 DUF1692-domain-containing protein [Dacryopinax primogenitus]
MASTSDDSLLSKLDSIGAPLKSFDAFPKVPSTYRTRSSGGGFITLGIALLCLLLVLNDWAEYVWGTTTWRFVVDDKIEKEMMLNVDITVAMPCHYISVDLRDAVGDRLHLSDQFKRDGTLFDARQATHIREQYTDYSAQQMVREAKTRRGRIGIFDWLRRRQPSAFQPTFNHVKDGSACRVYGSMEVKKVQANLHITTLGHGYHSNEHTDHSLMNLSHIITEFSFGPYFPDIVQPLDYTIESSDDPFTAFQYFLTVVPTEYRTSKGVVKTNQYSVGSHMQHIQHGRGTPVIFFKYDLEPLSLIVEQRTTTLIQFLIRLVGVVGGVWVCAGWAVKVGNKGLEVAGVVKKEDDMPIAETTATSHRRAASGLFSGEAMTRRRHQSVASISSLAGMVTGAGSSPLPTSSFTPGHTPTPGSSFMSGHAPTPSSSGFPTPRSYVAGRTPSTAGGQYAYQNQLPTPPPIGTPPAQWGHGHTRSQNMARVQMARAGAGLRPGSPATPGHARVQSMGGKQEFQKDE